MSSSIHQIQDSGKLITLDDGSKWKVSSTDSVTSILWLKFDKIEIEFGKLTNSSQRNASVHAIRVDDF